MKNVQKKLLAIPALIFSSLSFSSIDQDFKSQIPQKIDDVIENLQQLKNLHINCDGSQDYTELLRQAIEESKEELDTLESLGIKHELLISAEYTEIIDK